MSGTIYFIQAGGINGPIKIGYTKNLVKLRKKCAQTYNHQKLSVLAEVSGTLAQEKQLHVVFTMENISGEWFEPSPRLLELIAEIVDKGISISSWLSSADFG